jgi:hypothetical protein
MTDLRTLFPRPQTALLGLALLAFPALASAQEPRGEGFGGSAREPHRDRIEQFLERFDADGDGALSADELRAARERRAERSTDRARLRFEVRRERRAEGRDARQAPGEPLRQRLLDRREEGGPARGLLREREIDGRFQRGIEGRFQRDAEGRFQRGVERDGPPRRWFDGVPEHRDFGALRRSRGSPGTLWRILEPDRQRFRDV